MADICEKITRGKNCNSPRKGKQDPHRLSGTLKRRRTYSVDAVLRVTNRVTEHGSQATVLGNIGLPSIAQPSSDTLSPHQCTEEYQPQSLQVGQVIRQSLFTPIRNPSWNPLLPFTSAYEYKLARFFHQSKTSMKQIDNFSKTSWYLWIPPGQ
ncbi:hypothetical protein BGX38DRAFT_1281065 [Terfezia claveryi]|nr:hypothetical protein BGX38DRAFT_1281065 [Terfezia claveryi]